MDFCPRFPLVAIARVPRTKDVLFTRLRCGQWSCEWCAKKNQSIWRAYLYNRMPQVSDNWWLVTLTAHSRTRGMLASYRNLQTGIDRVLKRFRRVWKDMQYVRVFEKHPTSEALHAHMVCSSLTPFVQVRHNKNHTISFLPCLERERRAGFWTVLTFAKRAAQGSKIGYQTDVSKLRDEYAVYYATKYLTKAAQEIPIKGIRHVQTSQGIGSTKAEGDYAWTVLSYITARDFHSGEKVLDLQTGLVLDEEYFSVFDYYPPEMT